MFQSAKQMKWSLQVDLLLIEDLEDHLFVKEQQFYEGNFQTDLQFSINWLIKYKSLHKLLSPNLANTITFVYLKQVGNNLIMNHKINLNFLCSGSRRVKEATQTFVGIGKNWDKDHEKWKLRHLRSLSRDYLYGIKHFCYLIDIVVSDTGN